MCSFTKKLHTSFQGRASQHRWLVESPGLTDKGGADVPDLPATAGHPVGRRAGHRLESLGLPHKHLTSLGAKFSPVLLQAKYLCSISAKDGLFHSYVLLKVLALRAPCPGTSGQEDFVSGLRELSALLPRYREG